MSKVSYFSRLPKPIHRFIGTTRVFSGRRYYLHAAADGKRELEHDAERLEGQGYHTRITTGKGGSALWKRK